ncbi:MAG: DUF2807 domain-containing protein [Pseudomonadota bacterium]
MSSINSNQKSLFASAAVFAVALATTGQAVAQNGGVITDGDASSVFDDADKISIEDFIGAVQIATHNGPMEARAIGVSEAFPIRMVSKDGTLYVAGLSQLDMRKINREFWKRGRGREFDSRMEGFLSDYPSIKILAPVGSDLGITDSVVSARAGNLGGSLIVGGGIISAEIGDVAAADIGIDGAGDVLVGSVEDDLLVRVNGSGDVAAISAGTANIKINGSGDVEIGDIAGDTQIAISGSGDVDFGDVTGDIKIGVSGSGDVDGGDVEGGMSASVNGSGDIEISSISGNTSVVISGNGDIDIADGRAENLNVKIAGSGDFNLDGVSTNLVAYVGGNGVVSVSANEGSLKTSGDGDVYVGGQKKSKARKKYK